MPIVRDPRKIVRDWVQSASPRRPVVHGAENDVLISSNSPREDVLSLLPGTGAHIIHMGGSRAGTPVVAHSTSASEYSPPELSSTVSRSAVSAHQAKPPPRPKTSPGLTTERPVTDWLVIEALEPADGDSNSLETPKHKQSSSLANRRDAFQPAPLNIFPPTAHATAIPPFSPPRPRLPQVWTEKTESLSSCHGSKWKALPAMPPLWALDSAQNCPTKSELAKANSDTEVKETKTQEMVLHIGQLLCADSPPHHGSSQGLPPPVLSAPPEREGEKETATSKGTDSPRPDSTTIGMVDQPHHHAIPEQEQESTWSSPPSPLLTRTPSSRQFPTPPNHPLLHQHTLPSPEQQPSNVSVQVPHSLRRKPTSFFTRPERLWLHKNYRGEAPFLRAWGLDIGLLSDRDEGVLLMHELMDAERMLRMGRERVHLAQQRERQTRGSCGHADSTTAHACTASSAIRASHHGRVNGTVELRDRRDGSGSVSSAAGDAVKQIDLANRDHLRTESETSVTEQCLQSRTYKFV